jgi:hypothetical protein
MERGVYKESRKAGSEIRLTSTTAFADIIALLANHLLMEFLTPCQHLKYFFHSPFAGLGFLRRL